MLRWTPKTLCPLLWRFTIKVQLRWLQRTRLNTSSEQLISEFKSLSSIMRRRRALSNASLIDNDFLSVWYCKTTIQRWKNLQKAKVLVTFTYQQALPTRPFHFIVARAVSVAYLYPASNYVLQQHILNINKRKQTYFSLSFPPFT